MKPPLKATDVVAHVIANYKGVVRQRAFGETSLSYNPANQLPNGIYFVTVKENDGENDRASNLDRDGVYRVTLPISERSFSSRFGRKPDRPVAGETVDMPYDFSALDTIMPHPTYAWMNYICVLTPGRKTFLDLHPLMEEAYQMAIKKFEERVKSRSNQ